MEERQPLYNSPVNISRKSTPKPISPLCIFESNPYQRCSAATNHKIDGDNSQDNHTILQTTGKTSGQLNGAEGPSLQFSKGVHSNIVNDECFVTAF